MAHTQDDVHREAREWLKQFLPELDPEERLRGLDPELIEAWLAKQRKSH